MNVVPRDGSQSFRSLSSLGILSSVPTGVPHGDRGIGLIAHSARARTGYKAGCGDLPAGGILFHQIRDATLKSFWGQHHGTLALQTIPTTSIHHG